MKKATEFIWDALGWAMVVVALTIPVLSWVTIWVALPIALFMHYSASYLK